MARVAEVEKPSKEVKVNSHGTRIALKGLGMEREHHDLPNTNKMNRQGRQVRQGMRRSSPRRHGGHDEKRQSAMTLRRLGTAFLLAPLWSGPSTFNFFLSSCPLCRRGSCFFVFSLAYLASLAVQIESTVLEKSSTSRPITSWVSAAGTRRRGWPGCFSKRQRAIEPPRRSSNS